MTDKFLLVGFSSYGWSLGPNISVVPLLIRICECGFRFCLDPNTSKYPSLSIAAVDIARCRPISSALAALSGPSGPRAPAIPQDRWVPMYIHTCTHTTYHTAHPSFHRAAVGSGQSPSAPGPGMRKYKNYFDTYGESWPDLSLSIS